MKKKSGRMFLVVCRTTLDELPLGITPSRSRALTIAVHSKIPMIDKAAELMGVDKASPVCNAIITFHDGKPVTCDIVAEWDCTGPEKKPRWKCSAIKKRKVKSR